MKKKIVHFIFNLGRGGAETMMVRVIKELPEYEHVVVSLFPLNHFGNELQCDKQLCFNFTSLFQLPLGIFKFRKLVKKERPHIVHTHLFWPTIIARMSVYRRIPIITTIHAFVATSVEYTHWHIRFLDKLTYRFRKNIIIVVAKGALQEYFTFLKLKPWKAYHLYTFVDINRFNATKALPCTASAVFKLISVGALREQKNFPFLIEAFKQLKGVSVELHIYGTGNLLKELEQQIQVAGVNVQLKGEAANIEEILPQYDLYVMASKFEGFSLSVLEAMAMGMPLLLSDIASFREQAEDIASYFSLDNSSDFVAKLTSLMNMDSSERRLLGEKAKQRAVENFTLPKHIEGLRHIYKDAINPS
jgi:L-malate glycosyltransferase